MNLRHCGLVCFLVLHPMHFSTYQGLPEAETSVVSCPSLTWSPKDWRAPFDSEPPGHEIVEVSTMSVVVTGVGARRSDGPVMPTVAGPPDPQRRFDSEPASAEIGKREVPDSSLRPGPSTGSASTKIVFNVRATGQAPPVRAAAPDARGRFDSEAPAGDGEGRNAASGASGTGGGATARLDGVIPVPVADFAAQ